MKASEFIMMKALEHNSYELTKIAHDLYDTDKDIDYIVKDAGLLDGGLMAAGKALLKSNVAKNALIGAGTGTVAGAATAQDGQRLSGALKGGLIGGVLGGGGTYAKDVAGKASTILSGQKALAAKLPGGSAPSVMNAVKDAASAKNKQMGRQFSQVAKAYSSQP